MKAIVKEGNEGRNEIPWASRISCPVDLGISISQFDGDISLQLILEAHSLDSRDGLDQCRLSVSHMANSACKPTLLFLNKRYRGTIALTRPNVIVFP